jgi:hypothetical protein
MRKKYNGIDVFILLFVLFAVTLMSYLAFVVIR